MKDTFLFLLVVVLFGSTFYFAKSYYELQNQMNGFHKVIKFTNEMRTENNKNNNAILEEIFTNSNIQYQTDHMLYDISKVSSVNLQNSYFIITGNILGITPNYEMKIEDLHFSPGKVTVKPRKEKL